MGSRHGTGVSAGRSSNGVAGTVIGHDGGTIGQARLRAVPDAGVAIALLTNGGNPIPLFRELYGADCSARPPASRCPPTPSRRSRRCRSTRPRTPASTSARRASIRVQAKDGGIVAVQTTTGLGSELTPDPVEFPLRRVAEDDDLFRTQHPAAPGMWLPVRFVTLDDGTRLVARRREGDPEDRRLDDKGQRRGRCGCAAHRSRSRTNESISMIDPRSRCECASPLNTVLAKVTRSIRSRSVRNRPSACAAARPASSVSSGLAICSFGA